MVMSGTASVAGRKPLAGPVLTVDLGGTRMRVAVVGPAGAVLARGVEPTPRQAACPDALLALVDGMLDPTSLKRAVVGVPGRVEYSSGRLEHAPNLPATWLPVLTETELSGIFGIPVALANDADLAAVGEARFGAGRGFGDVAYLTLSTGVGAGVVLGGQLVHGHRSLAEVGHMVIDWAAAARGEPATLEALASGTALARLAVDAGIEGGAPEVVRRVRAGDAAAGGLWAALVQAAAVGVGNVAQLYSPEVIVIGGGLGRVGNLLLDPIREHLRSYGPSGLRVEVVGAALGDDAGLVGAAGWEEAFAPGKSSGA